MKIALMALAMLVSMTPAHDDRHPDGACQKNDGACLFPSILRVNALVENDGVEVVRDREA